MEEEKAINRALNGATDSNRKVSDKEKVETAANTSRIPKFFGANYKKVQVSFFFTIFTVKLRQQMTLIPYRIRMKL